MTPETSCLKKSVLALILATSSLSAFAQTSNLKEKKITLSDDSKITYHVKDNNIKEGSFYIKTAKSNQLVLKGGYTDNKKSGNWYFYDETGKLESIYSYQQNRLAYIDSNLLNKITINIPGKEKDVIENTKIPVLLSPINLFLSEISNSIIIPEEHFIINESLPIQILAKIDENGNPKYYLSYQHNGQVIDHTVKLKNTAFEINWIPAIYNNQPIKSEYILNTEIRGSAGSKEHHKRFRWND